MYFAKVDIKYESYSEYYRLTIISFKYIRWKRKMYFMLTNPFLRIGNAPL